MKPITYTEEFKPSETLIAMKKITKCKKCVSEENLCKSHSVMVKTSIINDVQNWIKYSSNSEELKSLIISNPKDISQ